MTTFSGQGRARAVSVSASMASRMMTNQVRYGLARPGTKAAMPTRAPRFIDTGLVDSSGVRIWLQHAGPRQSVEQQMEIHHAPERRPPRDRPAHVGIVHRPRASEPSSQRLLSTHVIARKHVQPTE